MPITGTSGDRPPSARDMPAKGVNGYPYVAYITLPNDSQRVADEANEENQGEGDGKPQSVSPLADGPVASLKQYDDITQNATGLEDIAADCWGALFFILVSDFPDLVAGRISVIGKLRIAFSLVVFVINVLVQAILLFFICTLLMAPGMESAQNVYLYFNSKAYMSGKISPDISTMSPSDQGQICGLALSQAVFVRVILFLWMTNNIKELRDNYTKMSETMNLPELPEGLDKRLMVLDTPGNEGKIVCLNRASKVGLLICIFIPKFAISLILSSAGCVWLMAAENVGDLILNSLALAFVVQVDELIAQVFFPAFYLQDLANLAVAGQALEVQPEAVQATQLKSFCFSSMTLVSALVIVELAVRLQPVIPGYNNSEVTVACIEYMRSRVPWCMPGNMTCFPKVTGIA
jgi:hypothetical protein